MAEFGYRDVTILYTSSDSAGWPEFLIKSFRTGETKIKLEIQDVEAVMEDRYPPEIQVAVKESHVILLLISDGLLTYMEKNSDWLGRMLDSRDLVLTSVCAVCLYVSLDDLTNTCVEHQYDLTKWDEFELNEEATNIKDLVPRVLGLLDMHSNNLVRRNRMTLRRAQLESGAQVIPAISPQVGEKAVLIFNEEVKGHLALYLQKTSSDPIAVSRVNPYAYTFVTPDRSTADDSNQLLIITVDGTTRWQLHWPRGTVGCEFSSLDLLCQAHGVSDRQQLDLVLAQRFKDSVCDDVNELTRYLKDNVTLEAVKTNYPSMLHWAAAHNLQELGAAILSTPAGSAMGHVSNTAGHDPAAMARANGHHDLADFIAQTLETDAIAEACKIYVERGSSMKSSTSEPIEEVIYEIMTTNQHPSTVKSRPDPPPIPSVPPIPPTKAPPPPIPSPRNLDSSKSSSPFTPKSTVTLPSNFRFPPQPPLPPKKSSGSSVSSEPVEEECRSVYEVIPDDHHKQGDEEDVTYTLAEPEWQLPAGAQGSRGQGELINIQQDVKSGAFSISEAEMLFKAWKERNGSGYNRSFKHKMASLAEIRSAYNPTLSAIKEVSKATCSISAPLANISMSFQDRPNEDNVRFSKASEISNTSSTDSGVSVPESSKQSEDSEEKRTSYREQYLKLLEDDKKGEATRDSSPPPALPPRPNKRTPKPGVKVYTRTNKPPVASGQTPPSRVNQPPPPGVALKPPLRPYTPTLANRNLPSANIPEFPMKKPPLVPRQQSK